MCNFMFLLDDTGQAVIGQDMYKQMMMNGGTRKARPLLRFYQGSLGRVWNEGLVAYFKSRKDREGPFGMTRVGSTVSVTHLGEEGFQVLWHASAVKQGRRKEGRE